MIYLKNYVKNWLKIHETLPTNKARLICDSFFLVSYNQSKFFETENALGAPVKVSLSSSSFLLKEICLCVLHIIFRHFSWRFEQKSQIVEIMKFLLQNYNRKLQKLESYQKDMMAILFKISSKITRLLVIKLDFQETF